MKLNSFTNGAIEGLKTQAIEHILYAPDFSKNIGNVEIFEQQHSATMQDLSVLRNYMMYLARDEQYAPLVIQNLKQYIAYLRARIYPLKDVEQDTKKVALESIVSLFEEIPKSYVVEKMSFRRPLLCSSFLSKTRLIFEDSEKMEQEMIDFIPKEFSYSSAIINQEDMSDLLQDSTFLQYCNFLINSESPLLYINCFADQVLDVLKANDELKSYCAKYKERTHFYKENARVAKRIKSIS